MELTQIPNDNSILQVVDQNWGIHTVIPKYVFEGATDGSKYEPYTPKAFPGTSLRGSCKASDKLSYPRK